jgi:hypothetical protein
MKDACGNFRSGHKDLSTNPKHMEGFGLDRARRAKRDAPPMSHDQLRDLFEHLDKRSGAGYACDHSFALTRSFLSAAEVALEPALEWLGRNGAGCDCEVSFNVTQQWGEVVGYDPPDEDAE